MHTLLSGNHTLEHLQTPLWYSLQSVAFYLLLRLSLGLLGRIPGRLLRNTPCNWPPGRAQPTLTPLEPKHPAHFSVLYKAST